MEKEEFIGPYKLVNKIGEGSFGQIFLGLKDQQYFAIKTEHISIVKPMLMLEFTIFKELHQQVENQAKVSELYHKGSSFPLVYLYQEEEHFSFMSMQKLDTTLQDLANIHLQNRLSKDVLLLLMYNTMKCLQQLHQIGYIYRDVKPSNFMVKQSDLDKEKGTIYLIDLGLCKKFMKKQTNEHIKCKDNKKMIGTPVFCSINTHKGIQNSRRDDLQSWIYMIIYLVKKLPWEDYSQRKSSKQGPETQQSKNKTYQKIGSVKMETNIIQLIKQEDKLPLCLCKIYEHVSQLDFQTRPNYEFMSRLMQEEYNRLVGTKTPLNDIFLRTKSNIDEKEKKNIKFTFKIPQKKTKQNYFVQPKESSVGKELEQITLI